MKVKKNMSHSQPHRAATPRLTVKAKAESIQVHPGMVIKDEAGEEGVVVQAFNDLDLVIYKNPDGSLDYSSISEVDVVRGQWSKVEGEMINEGGGDLQRTFAPNSIPALARPGMMVSFPGEHDLVIVETTADFCIAENAKGRRFVERWHAVSIERVQPDLAAGAPGVKLVNADPFYRLALEMEQARERVVAELRNLSCDNKNKDQVFDHTYTGLLDAFDTISTLLSEGTNNLRLEWAKGKLRPLDPHQDHAA